MATGVLVLSYSGCSTCRRALRWLDEKGVKYTVRPIVEKPPTVAELKKWVAASKVPIRKWLNTSGQSYRALGKEKLEGATEDQIARLLSEDGKLVKRPVLVNGASVVVGFKPEQYDEVLS